MEVRTCDDFLFLQNVRQEYMDVEADYHEKKATYDKVAVGLDMEKQGYEKECNALQVLLSCNYHSCQGRF